MSGYQLWSDEIEAMRPEARDVVEKGFEALRELMGRTGPPPTDRLERARHMRENHARNALLMPECADREIAGVRCRVAVPDGPARAVYLHFHGGAMVAGAPEMMDFGSVHMRNTYGVAVVSVDYRKAPEHPYPAGPDDGTAVAAWLLEHAESEFGSGRILMGGESAGGYMTAAVLLRIRDELQAADRILGANLVFGWYDFGRSPSQRGLRPHDGPDILDPETLDWATDCYLPGLSDDKRRDPAISPAFADLRDLPPALFSVGSTDHLLDDTLMMASRYAAAGNDTELFIAPDLPHAFMAFPCGITTAWQEVTHAWITRVLAD
jgi:acetyl esterase/lipase